MRRSFGGLSAGRGRGRTGDRVQGVRSIIGRYKIDGDVKNSIGSGDKELPCMTHGHELSGGELLEGRGILGVGGRKLGQL